MNNAPVASARTTTKEMIELYSKVGAFIVICLYVVGFLTVNRYLDQLGVSDFSLIQARFITAGVLTLLFMFFDFLCISLGILLIKSLRKLPYRSTEASGSRKKDLDRYTRTAIVTAGWILGCILIIVPWVIFAYFVYPIRCTPPISFPDFVILDVLDGSLFSMMSYMGDAHVLYFLCTATSFILAWILRVASNSFIQTNQEGQGQGVLRNTPIFLILLLTGFVLFFNLYLGLFVKWVYPQVPEQFGGGQSKLVILLFGDSAIKGAAQLGIRMETESLSKPLILLFEVSDAYVISGSQNEAYKSKAIRINKSMIQAIEIIQFGPGCSF